jgi:hypothetical protein
MDADDVKAATSSKVPPSLSDTPTSSSDINAAADNKPVVRTSPRPLGGTSSATSSLRGAISDDAKLMQKLKVSSVRSEYVESLRYYLQFLKETREGKADDKLIDEVQGKLKDAFKDHVKGLESNLETMDKLLDA